MSTKHLAAGSEEPPKVEGKLRLYSMEYCPYAHRARLVLRAKDVPHDIVNVNLVNKPEWLFKVHPEGKVPALDTGDEIVVESIDIADYLDEKYPEPPLYPSDSTARAVDKELIKKIGALTGVFTKAVFGSEKKSAAECLEDFIPHLELFEKELEKRGTVLFGGDTPGMVDYMLWPWGERAGTVSLALGERLPVAAEQFPHLRAWRNNMRTQPAVDGIYNGPEKFYKVVQFKTEEVVNLIPQEPSLSPPLVWEIYKLGSDIMFLPVDRQCIQNFAETCPVADVINLLTQESHLSRESRSLINGVEE